MKHKGFGFTLLEMALFLALTGLLFVGVVVGTQNSIRQQKYNDSVQNYANFWADIYASVANTQNFQKYDSSGPGRTDQAIYGKLIVFGQDYGLNGEPVEGQKIFTYDVIGNATVSGTGTAISVIKDAMERNNNVNFNVVFMDNDKKVYSLGATDSYSLTWGAEVQNVDGSLYTGSILVIRHPRSGVIDTFVNKNVIAVNELFRPGTVANSTNVYNLLKNSLDGFNKDGENVNFCINSEDIGLTLRRRVDVKLLKNARNTSGIEVLSFDNEGNPCSK